MPKKKGLRVTLPKLLVWPYGKHFDKKPLPRMTGLCRKSFKTREVAQCFGNFLVLKVARPRKISKQKVSRVCNMANQKVTGI